jgi:3-demethoxyubiquinol 3-hydroxylase
MLLQTFGDGMAARNIAQLSAREALTIARIVRVNHAGEFGAIRIYAAQIMVAARRHPDIVPELAEMLAHERKHCAEFLAAMPARNSRPCRIMALWSWGGSLLGVLTALMGRQAIWICTAAVEAAVHRHLDDQLHFLQGRDGELRDIILSIREEELAHLHHAEERIVATGMGSRALHHLISFATDAVIWLSTWGDSSRMARDLRLSGAAPGPARAASVARPAE